MGQGDIAHQRPKLGGTLPQDGSKEKGIGAFNSCTVNAFLRFTEKE